MTLQSQLAQSQRAPAFPAAGVTPFEVRFDFGLLGNKSIQVPNVSGTEKFAENFRTGHAVVLAHVENAESAEMAWLVENARELGQHKGEWLLIQGRQLLVHSPDFAVVRAAIRQRQVRSPFVYYVPTDEESNSVTI
jgi:hypothetical protein